MAASRGILIAPAFPRTNSDGSVQGSVFNQAMAAIERALAPGLTNTAATNGILTEGISAGSISSFPTLANPPTAPVFDDVISGGTNYQRPQGVIVQPDATVGAGQGITLRAGASVDSAGGLNGLFAGYSKYSTPGWVTLGGGSSLAPDRGAPADPRFGGAVFNPGTSTYGLNSQMSFGPNAIPLLWDKAYTWRPGENPNGLTFYTAVTPMRVSYIIARLDAANVGASTLRVVKVASGTAVSAGTSLTTTTLNAAGAPNTATLQTLAAYTPAAALLTFTGQPSNGQTVTIGLATYIFQTTLTNVANNVHIGANATASITNLVRAVDLTGTPGTDYAAATLISNFVSGVVAAGSTATFTALAAGAQGGNIATTTTVTGASWPGATLGSGTPGTSVIELQQGESLGIVTTGGGNWLTSSGSITVHVTPIRGTGTG